MPVQGTAASIGQYVFGGTSGSPLVITNNQLEQGLSYSEDVSTTALTVTTTAAQLDSATFTPVAGTYLVVASVNITASSAAGNVLTIELYLGGTAIAGTSRTAMPTGTGAFAAFQNMSLSTNKIVVANGSQAIQLYGVTSAGTVTVTGLVFDLVRIV